MNPNPVDPTPTLTFSIKNWVPISKGNTSLNPVLNPITTSLVAVVNPIVAIPIPLVLLIGKIIGGTGLTLDLFLITDTWSSPNLYFNSISSTLSLVDPSKTNKVGALIYPLPTEVIPTDSILESEFKNNVWCNIVDGIKVLSDGKSNRIALTLVDLIWPIEVLIGLTIAPLPVIDATEVIPGNE